MAAGKRCFASQFDRKLKLEFNGVKVTSDAGLLLMLEELNYVF